jgi:hypothetical protein
VSLIFEGALHVVNFVLITSTEFGVPMKIVTLDKMCLNVTDSKVYIGNYLSVKLTIQNGLKQGAALSPLLFNFTSEYVIRKIKENLLV